MATKVKKEVEISAKDLASKTLKSLTYKFKKFEGALKTVQSAAGNVARSARGIITTFGGAATAAVAAINKMATQADNLNTMANLVGINIEAYQKLRYAAEQNDVSTEGFDKSLQKLSKSMGELHSGSGALYSALKKSNPQLLRQLRAAKDNETAFRLMMQAINKAGTAQQKAYLATAAFGKSGQELISLANIGAESMALFEKEAENFGLVSSQGGNAADEWGRAVVRVRKALEGVGYTIMNKVLPVLTPVVNKISEWVAQNKELIADRVIEWGNNLINILKGISAVVSPLINLFSQFPELLYAVFGAKMIGLIANIVKFTSALKNLYVLIVTNLVAGLKSVVNWFKALSMVGKFTWIGLLITAVGLLIYYWKDLTAWFQKMLDKYPALRAMFNGIKALIMVILSPIKLLWRLLNWIVNLFSTPELTVEQKESANNWMADQGLIERPKYSPAYSSSLQMSPLADSQIQIATAGGIRQSADINVRFDNTPPMTRIDTVSRDTNLDLEIYRGANGGTIQ